ncbi:hypothetical protein [Flavobacterium sp. GT3P67]|uniref:hypothetical protein n=1 Tax=Flavobacterium sp. GT3P67 TaxID=2541722 RepID=UPI001051F1F7|nr:hypothetical protein [Flavobacterium sp. GT3P67]TDE53651.1 hypothetical protein E0H99_06390 [Flavobacterium sp. GT3P67]
MSSLIIKELPKSKVETVVEKLVLNAHTLKANLKCYTGQQGDFWVSIIPSLNVSGYGKTEKESIKDLNYNATLFCDDLFSVTETQRRGELNRLGWVLNKLFKKKYSKSYIDENGVLQNFDFPEKVKKTILETI